MDSEIYLIVFLELRSRIHAKIFVVLIRRCIQSPAEQQQSIWRTVCRRRRPRDACQLEQDKKSLVHVQMVWRIGRSHDSGYLSDNA
jgi:hypothetical protein